jgi:hypothetical protein
VRLEKVGLRTSLWRLKTDKIQPQSAVEYCWGKQKVNSAIRVRTLFFLLSGE